MRTVAVKITTFAELSDRAKEKARDAYRERFEFEPSFDDFEQAADVIGIEFEQVEAGTNRFTGKKIQRSNLMYSGFWSQGDGASFTGSYSFKPGCSLTVRNHFPTDTTLHEIADGLTGLHNRLRLKDGGKLAGNITEIRHGGSYCHSQTMDATAYDANGDELEIEVSDEFRDIMRDFANWIYKSLEEQYYADTSDEAIDDYLSANDYEFTEDGEAA